MSLRDYNLPDPEPVEGAVRAWQAAPAGTCCPACPYASPSVARSLASGAEA